MTVKSQWQIGTTKDPAGLLIGGVATQPKGEPSLISARLTVGSSGWFPVWFVTLESPVKADSESSVVQSTKIGPLSLAPGVDYQSVISYNPEEGVASLAVRDASGKTLYSGAWEAVKHTGLTYAVANADVFMNQYPWYEPVETKWSLGTKVNGTFVPRKTLNPGTDIWVRVVTETQGTGQFRLVIHEETKCRAIAMFDAQQGEMLIPIQSNVLPLGSTTVALQYLEDGHVQFTDHQQVVVGNLQASLGSVRLDRRDDLLKATMQLRSEVFLYDLQVRLAGELESLVWDNQRQAYMAKPYGVLEEVGNNVANITFIQPGATNIPIAFTVPEEPGLWRARFSFSVTPDLAVKWTGNEHVFATTTPTKLAQLQGVSLPVPKDISTLRFCTYNIMGFQGYPESEAAVALGAPNDQRRIDHFKEVFNQLDCDVVGIQEGGSAEMLERLAAALNMHVAIYPSSTIYLGGLLSRFPILESRQINNAYVTGGPFSRFAGASLLDLDGQPTWVVNLHAYPHSEAT
ncbi:MAG: endonuclease/exonuclease/phosphatase family protein, partial [Limnochordia bacterium]